MRTPLNWIELLAAFLLFIGLLALGALYFVPGLESTLRGAYTLVLEAEEGKDLTEGDKVTIQGIQVGEVVEVDLEKDNRVRVTCRIEEKYAARFREGTRVKLVPPAVVGSSQVQVLLGTGKPAPWTDRKLLLPAEPETSITEKAAGLLSQVQGMLEKVDNLVVNSRARMGQLEKILAATEDILTSITEGRGALGKFVYDQAVYSRLQEVLAQLAESIGQSRRLVAQFEEFATFLPELRKKLEPVLADATSIASNVERASRHLPDTVVASAGAVKEGRKIVESLKRNFLIRGNLPRDLQAEPMAPATMRAFPGGDGLLGPEEEPGRGGEER